MQRTIACALLLSALFAGHAAADGPAPRSWTGFYAGAGAGVGSATQIQSLSFPGFGTVFSESIGGQGAFGTIAAGYDYRIMQQVVVGGFLDYDFSRIATNNSDPGLFSLPFDHTRSWSVGGRVGLLTSPTTLWYVAGGYTQATFDLDLVGKTDFRGHFVGGGVETQLAGNWLLRGEYRFAQFSSQSVLTCPCETFDVEPSLQTGRVLLIYRFGTGEAAP
jgi:outer membrane immunogenic protein